jgi:hypothetical protein
MLNMHRSNNNLVSISLWEVREAKKKVPVIAVALMAVAMLAIPIIGTVIAIGPLKALEVGKNPNVDGIVALGVVMLDDVGPNNIMWVNALGMIISLPDAKKGSGKMNNAIIADHDTVVDMQANPAAYNNKWVYLSGTGGAQWNGHGMFYWVVLPLFGPIASAALEQEYSDGVFHMTNKVGK